MEQFIGELKARYPNRARHRPKAFKARVLHLVARQLPPFSQPTGRPRDARITRAVELFKAQGRQRNTEERTRIDWKAIALECIPGFAKIRSDYCRRAALGNLRNSVYARVDRKRAYKRKRRLSPSKTPDTC